MSSIVVAGDTSGSVSLQAPAVAGSTTLTLPTSSGTVLTTASGQVLTAPVLGTPASGSLVNCTDVNYTGFKNRIINGNMAIDQRNAGASVTPVASTYTLDRWIAYQSVASKYSVQQNAGAVTPPVGVSNYIGVTSLSAYSILTSDFFGLRQPIEGFNFADMNWGTANASTVTLSFWVRSSLTGTFGGALINSTATRSYPFSYSIPVANTWTTISVTIAGDTTGTWIGATNGVGVDVRFGIGSGATYRGTTGSWQAGNFVQPTGTVSVVGTSGATFYITGVQLEKGSVATSFDQRAYSQELAMCQRYYQTDYAFQQGFYGYYIAYFGGSYVVSPQVQTVVPMRTTPTVTISNASVQYYSYSGVWTDTTLTGSAFGNTNIFIRAVSDGDGRGKLFRTGSSGTAPNPYYLLNAEL